MTDKTQTTIIVETEDHTLPIGFVPTPTNEYRIHRKIQKVTVQPGQPALKLPNPIPLPPIRLFRGARVLMWKQDPSVNEIGVRKAYLAGRIVRGPSDLRITTSGTVPVDSNVFGDFIQTQGTEAFDAVHTYAVVRQTLTMYQRALGGLPLPWQWNNPGNTDRLEVFPHGLPNTMNAFYSRNSKSLRFGDFIRQGSTPPARIFTCRSFDIVAHETGHAVLDGLKPGWLGIGNPPQTGGLHESFGDITAIFLALSQLDQVEAVIAQTKGDLHDKTFLADLAEEFGLALGRPNGLRNADNDLKLSQAGTEVHAISQVFTGAIYDILADIYRFEADRNQATKDPAAVLFEVAQYLCKRLLQAIVAAPAVGATYADVANQMLIGAAADGSPTNYRTFIRTQFTKREVIVSPTPLVKNEDVPAHGFAADVKDKKGAVQDRRTCCGTMQLDEYLVDDELIQSEIQELVTAWSQNGFAHEHA